MVKTNKKSLVALVVMALLLVASIVMSATGAWFTAAGASYGSDDLKFGTISIEASENAGIKVVDSKSKDVTARDVFPGDKVTISGTITNKGDAAYIFVTFVATVDGTPVNDLLPANLTKLEGVEGVNNVYYLAAAKDATIVLNSEIDFNGAQYGNDYQGDPIVVTMSYGAIQQANFDDAAAAYNVFKTLDLATGKAA